MLEYFGNSHLYTAFELHRMALSPVNMLAKINKQFYSNTMNPLAYTDFGRRMAAGSELLERVTRRFAKPSFDITETTVKGKTYAIEEHTVFTKVFCRLMQFRKTKPVEQKKLLIVAPMSGHYATLLKGTVEGFLPHFDVYITDWRNAQDVSVTQGSFDLDDYINYVMDFIRHVGKDIHVMAVCQPAAPVMAAVALMNAENSPFTPASMTLIGGPIDARKNPTQVNLHADKKSIDWFRHNVITRVPLNYPGALRAVYPGFVQLTGFMSLNMDKHITSHLELFDHLVEGDGDEADAHRTFYNEYLSVMDIPAEFYLQTIETVFQKFLLPKGEMVSRGRKVLPGKITKTALLCIEGERDDISGIGQTKAAIDLCTGLPAAKKQYHLQKGVGHYGQFNGRKFREEIVPAVVKFIEKNA